MSTVRFKRALKSFAVFEDYTRTNSRGSSHLTNTNTKTCRSRYCSAVPRKIISQIKCCSHGHVRLAPTAHSAVATRRGGLDNRDVDFVDGMRGNSVAGGRAASRGRK